MTIVTCPHCGAKNRIDQQRSATQQPVCGRCGTKLDLSSSPLTITDANFNSILSSAGDKPLLIDAWAAWCGPCRMIAPIVDELAAESAGRYLIGKLDVDANPDTSSRFQISAIPTMLLFKNGRLADRIVGLQPKQALLAKLESHLHPQPA